MKNLFKFMPASLALVALASCSNEFSSLNAPEIQYTKTLDVEVEGINDAAETRAMYSATAAIAYETSDVIRVYDADVLQYDKYTFDGTKFGTTGTKVAAADAKFAIFPSEQVKWGDNDSDPKVAVTIAPEVNISDEMRNGKEIGGTKYFVANIPSWGEVTEVDADKKLKVTLYRMTALLRLKINHLDGNADGNVISLVSTLPTPSKIAGTFSATLDKDIKTTGANTTTCLAIDESLSESNEIKINLGTEAIDDAYVFFPIVPGTYASNDLQIQVNGVPVALVGKNAEPTGYIKNSTGTPWTIARSTTIARELGEVSVNPTALAGNDPALIQALIEANKDKGSDVTINVTYKAGNKLTTSNNPDLTNHTITIPSDLNNNVILNIPGGADLTAKNLTITGGNANYGVTFNFTVDGTTDFGDEDAATAGTKVLGAGHATDANSRRGIIIDSKSPVTLAGVFKNCDIKVASTNSGAVTLGTENEAFTAECTPVNQTFDFQGKGDLNLVNVANSAAISVSGTPAAVVNNLADVTYAGTAKVNSASNLTSLTAAKATEVNIAGNITTVTTKAATVNVIGVPATPTTITNLRPQDGVKNINLDDAVITTLGSNAAADAYTGSANVIAVASKGISGIGVVVAPTNASFSFTSTWDLAVADDPASLVALTQNAGVEQIYTAAQLVKVTTAAKLNADITFEANTKPFPTYNLTLGANAAFDGNNKTITGLNAPLFNILTANAGGSTVKNLTLKDVVIEEQNNIGVLAKTVVGATTADKTLAITNVIVNGATLGIEDGYNAATNIGGLFGNASKNITFNGCQVTGATIKGFSALGGFIGLYTANDAQSNIVLSGATVDSKSRKTNVTFEMPFKYTKYNTGAQVDLGKIGNFIGSIDAPLAFGANITVGAAAAENAFSYFFTDNIVASALDFDKKMQDPADPTNTKSYVGMKNEQHAVGFSTEGTNLITIRYATLTKQTRQGATYDEINVFE